MIIFQQYGFDSFSFARSCVLISKDKVMLLLVNFMRSHFLWFAFFLSFSLSAPAFSQESEGGPSISAPSASDDFFDANQLVPQGEMSKKGPNAVDPNVQPASKLIVVKQNHKASSREARITAAERALNLGRYDSAVQMFDLLFDENKKDARVAMGRAVSLQRLGRFDEAMQMYEVVSELEPKNIDVKVNMLGLLASRYPAVALQRMLALYNDNRSNANLVAQIAIAYAQSGDSRSALQFLGTAASMEPRNANHLFNYAVIADRAGYTDKAIEYYERSLEVDTIHGGGRSIPRDAVYDRLVQIR